MARPGEFGWPTRPVWRQPEPDTQPIPVVPAVIGKPTALRDVHAEPARLEKPEKSLRVKRQPGFRETGWWSAALRTVASIYVAWLILMLVVGVLLLPGIVLAILVH